ncbi:26S proteasome non-ATPase regulatory subunit 4-like [Homalodisca vitripennis]|uniref:26S proteasome non-ATPase regulatory subunit 4-like n=1 Tax=Homalodisca vitripennis TaxID=197043 RepID=UPI001EEA3C02|nr:26S proteasome non-ATPase regulatory subunit 4-like [Homalodisca vitripennis]KAG8332131.1 proteasome assembly [Homalodisca vitripennis]
MVLESTMICVDNSDYMRNGDFSPTRLRAQEDAVRFVSTSKLSLNPENNVGLLTLANVTVLSTFITDVEKLMKKLRDLEPQGTINVVTGVRVAQLALKHRQGRNHRMRIVVFVGSPLKTEKQELEKLAKRLKKEKVNVDVVNFGEEIVNTELLSSFVETLNGKDGGGSHLITVPSGNHLTQALISSPVISDDGAKRMGSAYFGTGVDSYEDPELALALRISLEEQRQREEQATRRAEAENKRSTRLETIQEGDDEEASLHRAMAMSMEQEVPDFAQMTEEEQIAFAMQLSLREQQGLLAENEKQKTAETPTELEQTDEGIDDPEFLQNVLENLPGVDPQSEEMQQTLDDLAKAKQSTKKNNRSQNGRK